MNKLRALAYATAGLLVVLSGWGALRYGDDAGLLPFVAVAALGLALPLIPRALALVAFRVRLFRRRSGDRASFSFERGSLFVSDQPVDDPPELLASIRDAVTRDDRFDAVADDEFAEGAGLTVGHAGYHNSFVRFSEGKLVVTGASKRTHALADLVADACSLSFETVRNNPFLAPRPVRGGTRVVLGLVLVVLAAGGVAGVAGAAYPGGAYNTAEKAVLVGFDARGDFVPGTTRDETRLEKAAFLVDGLAEEAVEVRWEQNSTDRVVGHGRQSLAISEDVRSLLRAARADGLDGEAAARADRIERDLHDAEREVAAALAERAGGEGVREGPVLEVRDELLRAAETPA